MYKIAFIAPVPFFEDRGTPVRIYEIVKALQRKGHKVTVFTYHLGRDAAGIDIKRIPNIPWYAHYSGASYNKILADVLLFLKVAKSVFRSDFDVMHASIHEGAAIGELVKIFKRIPLVFDAEGSLTGEMLAQGFVKKSGTAYRFWHKVESLIVRKAGAITTSASNTANLLIEQFGIDKKKIFLVKNGVDTAVFRPDYATAELRTKLGIPKGDKVVVYLGLLTEHQGIEHLLNAIPLVLKEVPNVHFLIMGYPNVEKYKDIAGKLGIAKKVTFTGKMNYDMAPKYLALGDLAVSAKIPASGEGNAKIYDYMAAGLPVVVFDTHVNREILGELGVYVKLEDTRAFADAIKKLLLDDKLAESIGKKLREKAVLEYSWDDATEKVLSAYEYAIRKVHL